MEMSGRARVKCKVCLSGNSTAPIENKIKLKFEKNLKARIAL